MSNSDSDEDNIIRYGTPLEPYEEDEIPTKRKYQQPTDQYAVDEHGRRRFHGAFTGGFSAGFGNTVGSQEGWTPTSFKSSRNEKAGSQSQRPEDFMDDEDRSEFGIAPKQMQTRSEFSGQKRTRPTYHDGPIPGEPVLDQLVRAVHETAAVRILRDMGWKPGQGTGDRVTRSEKKKAKEQQKVYGCYMPEELKQPQHSEDQDSNSSNSEFEYETLFAPDDYEPYILNRKSDRFGLGYQGLSRHSVLGNMIGEYGEGSSKSHLKMKDKGKKVSIRGQAFGVGAFEADDEDIYAKEDMSHYDFAIGGSAPETVKKKTKDKGKNVLEGFVPSSRPLPPVPSYPPPAMPRDWTPLAAGARRTRFDASDAPQRDQGLGRHELTAEARGALLGEAPPKAPEQTEPKQTDKNSKEDLLAKIIGRNVNFISSNTNENSAKNDATSNADATSVNNSVMSTNKSAVSSNNSVTLSNVKIIDYTKPATDTPDYISIKDSGKELDNVFKPFVSNPLKQTRYENYLKDKGTVPERDGSTDKLSEWERERELMEFEQAAKLYRPLTGVMGDRFTHATEPDDSTNPLATVSKSRTNYGLATPEQIKAAEKGVYGIMTRVKISWRPESVVCKRFNIPDPGVVGLEPKKEDKPKVSYSIFSYLESSVHDKDSFAKEQTKFSGSKSLRDTPDPKLVQTSVTAMETDDNIGRNTDSNTIKNTDSNAVENTDSNAAKNTDSNTVKNNDSNTIKNANNVTTKDTNNAVQNTVKKTDIITAKNIDQVNNQGGFKRMTVAELFLKESEKSKEKGQEVTETIEQFDKMDLYKSIFLSDSEEESNDGSSKLSDINIINDFMETPTNVQRNTSPPRGIFANIDFDEINSWRRNADNKSSETKDKTSTDNKETSKDNEKSMSVDEVYGPKIPETIQKKLMDAPNTNSNRIEFKDSLKEVVEVDSSSSDSWVDMKEIKDKKKKKKSKHKKQKSKHKKSKHKKKDK